ncbi:MAG: cytochrome c3 family protein [Chloroflexia bacterium]
MQRLCGWLSRRRWYVSVPLVLAAGIVAYLLIAGLLDWANSTRFCGTTCHSMTPEYTAYQESFHARVRCAECHVGPGLAAEVQAKWQGIRELWLYVTNTYERPIPSPVENLRPARETCEECHWPEVFYSDRAVVIPHYADDEANTRTNTYMLVKIGGGTSRKGQGKGIHWHIENRVEYIATDPQRQNIPWVRAQLNGRTVTFVDVTQPLSDAQIASAEIRVMDCMDCHNRATHIFRSAATAVDEAMANGRLPTDLPYLRKQAVEVMQASYTTQDEALAAIAAIPDFYRQNYPGIYEQRREALDRAVQVLQEIYRYSHFPDARVYPDTYPDNLGHSQFPGCFRCHDGKHLSSDGQSIRLHCNICHTIPQTVVEGQPAPAISLREPAQPESHLASNWIAEHRTVVDASCSSCHEPQTFCANVNCHGRSWPYVDLSVVTPPFPLPTPATPTPVVPTRAPTPAPTTGTTPAAVPSFFSEILPVLLQKCGNACHSVQVASGGFRAVDYAGVMQVVVAGDPDASRLVQVQRGKHAVLLSPEELERVIAWIRAGAPDN